MHIREARPEDAAELASVFFASVRQGDSPYTQAQRVAWLAAEPDAETMARRIDGLFISVAKEANAIVGFMGLREADGYVDLAFILPDARGKGMFRALVERTEERAQAADLPRLWTHASLMAQPAFQALGFQVIHHETVDRAGQQLPRALMEKVLT